MKSFYKRQWVVVVAFALIGSSSASAQTARASEVAASAATPASNIKAIRAANRDLQKKVRRALTHTKKIDASGISVRAGNGAITLQGVVPEPSQIELAVEAAKAVPGVTSVDNQLKVLPYGQ